MKYCEGMRVAWLLILLAGCLDHEHEDPTLQVTFDINGIQLDEVELVMAPSFNVNWRGRRTTGPLTPGLIAQGVTEPPAADLWTMDPENFYERLARFDDPNPDWSYQTDKLWPQYPPVLLMAIGRRVSASGELVAVAGGVDVVTNDQLELDKNTQVRITLAAVDIEEWGYGACKRYHTGDKTAYLIWNSDFDCDHMFTAADCRPDDYCDPSATTGPLADNCVCP